MKTLFGDAGGGGLNRELIPLRAQADDAAHGDVREIRVVAEFFAREGVRQVQFDEGQLHAEQRVTQRHAGVREATWIQDGEADAIGPGGLDAIDELVLGVALEGDQFVAKLGGRSFGAFFDGGQGVCAINLGFALPQQVQVRPIE